jgi:hypothetical protein
VISRDRRHRGVLLLVEEEVAERSFADWSMGFKDLSGTDPGDVAGFSDFLRSGHLDYLGDRAEPVFHLIQGATAPSAMVRCPRRSGRARARRSRRVSAPPVRSVQAMVPRSAVGWCRVMGYSLGPGAGLAPVELPG